MMCRFEATGIFQALLEFLSFEYKFYLERGRRINVYYIETLIEEIHIFRVLNIIFNFLFDSTYQSNI